ncbi:hypothetical protein EV215_0347 [Hypnocyclicus thermotrophus]|uniref:Uncharacterized protein n=1 Tax=Hypnocyclicus thermotrophus TaxID=1627895 RepID=A0AA46I6P1_9FUSO|nr:hypothetical protein [Hypnocyclicus thermotrophus]TDT72537.1 hypothetical protein EV215_0347 [Hypnocyclicus thermotrophus]
MDFYKKLIIKILESSSLAENSKILKKLKLGYDLSQAERRELEELIDNII